MCKKVILSLALFVSCWGGIGAGVFGNIREFEIRLEYAERTITGAREIVERTGSQLEQSTGNLRRQAEL